MVTLKVIDKTSEDSKVTSVKMFGYGSSDLPRISAVGDILYLKMAQVDSFGGEKEIKFNVNSNNCWEIYSGPRPSSYQLPALLYEDEEEEEKKESEQ